MSHDEAECTGKGHSMILSRKLRRMVIDSRLLLSHFKPADGMIRVKQGLPQDARLVDIRFEPRIGLAVADVHLLIWSDTFNPVSRSEEIPFISLWFQRVHDNVIEETARQPMEAVFKDNSMYAPVYEHSLVIGKKIEEIAGSDVGKWEYGDPVNIRAQEPGQPVKEKSWRDRAIEKPML